MMGRHHLLSGAVAGLGVGAVFGLDQVTTLELSAVLAVSALGPDLDCPKAILGTWLSPACWATRVLRLFGQRPWWGMPRPAVARALAWTGGRVYHATRTRRDDASWDGTHRTLTHTWPWALLTALPFAVLALAVPGVPGWLAPAVCAGHLLHLLGDWLTPFGVPLAWPLTHRGKRWWMFRSPAPFRAGGPVEWTLVAPVLWASLAALVGVLLDLSGRGTLVLTIPTTVLALAEGVVRAEDFRRQQRERMFASRYA